MLAIIQYLTARTATVVVALASLSLLPGACLGQVSVVRSGSFEFGGFFGSSYGVDGFRVMGGANVTYAVNRWLLPYAEYSYLPGIARTLSVSVPGSPEPVVSNSSTPFSDFNAGVHIRIPIRESRIVPYVVIGVGSLTHFTRTVNTTYIGADGLPHNLPSTDPGGTEFAFDFGGGLRYYVNQRFGFRLEAKGYWPNSSVTDGFGKVEAGFFYQVR